MESPTSTFDLIRRFKQGDADAFAPLFERHHRRLAVLIHYKLSPDKRHPENVDEILQETFMAAFQDLNQFQYRTPGSFLRWLSRIVDHVIIDGARRQNRQKRKPVEMLRFRSDSYPQGVDPAHSHTPSRILTQREDFEGLLARLNALPEQYREVILMAKMEGLSTQEMAERLGKSRESTALLLHRAIQRFRELSERQ